MNGKVSKLMEAVVTGFIFGACEVIGSLVAQYFYDYFTNNN